MENLQMAIDLDKIVKEGFLKKESRYLKSWRKRWFVLTLTTLYSFKEKKVYSDPTEALRLNFITKIKSTEEKEFSFKIDTIDRQFSLEADNNLQKQQWIQQIGKTVIKLSTQTQDNCQDQ